MFEPFLIVEFESLSRPQCEKMNLKSFSHCWKGFKYAEDAGKLKNLQELEDFCGG
ncbi:MAG: hypothetical protein ACRCZO_03980 [Cetobacterium sp.]